eukprot:TRINITY_DN22355_c0_g1_i1.p1 TRINITY_DN22355_c0_g1~~TRINITY_DN22355_c0_g1_i1.p1  ORF type:complete len:370 (+),score=126.78 TRINITY_DN22355_c0_g1_i1:110-1219(+)
MEALSPAQRSGIAAALWRRVENAKPEGGASAAYYVKFFTAGGGYSCVVVDDAFTEGWVGGMDAAVVVARIAEHLTQFQLPPESLCALLRRALSGDDAAATSPVPPANAPFVTFRPTGKALTVTVTSSVALSADLSLPLAWHSTLQQCDAAATLALVASLVVRPLLGVASALTYSHHLYQTTILAKDRELKMFRDTYGNVTGLKKPTPPLFPEQYCAALLGSDAVAERLHAADLGCLGDSSLPSHAVHTNMAPGLYQQYMRTAETRRAEEEAAHAPMPDSTAASPPPPPAAADPTPPPGPAAAPGAVAEAPESPQAGMKRKLESYDETEEEKRRRAEVTQMQTQAAGGKKVQTKAGAERAKQKKLRKLFK